jgi:hypothetical protein
MMKCLIVALELLNANNWLSPVKLYVTFSYITDAREQEIMANGFINSYNEF